jgi:transcriptional repressor NrdR
MKCPICGQQDTRVIDSRPAENGASLRRRRHCDGCDHRFTTHERVALPTVYVLKKDGRREEFDRDKLRNGVSRACNKRPIAIDDIERLLSEVENAVRQDGGNEVDSAKIGELVMQQLFQMDQVAYVRFASVYQRFDDVKRFAQLLERMSRHARRDSQREVSRGEDTSPNHEAARGQSRPERNGGTQTP